MPPVKSTDPRKAAFVAKVRAEFPHISKVTDVFERQGVLSGRAMEWDPGTRTYMFLGDVSCAWETIPVMADPTLRGDYETLFKIANAHLRIGHGLGYTWGWDTRPTLRLRFRDNSTTDTLDTLTKVLQGQGFGSERDGQDVVVRVLRPNTATN